MQMGRLFVHVNDRRYDILPAYPPGEEIRRPLKIRSDLLRFLAFKEPRAGGYQRIHKPGAVPAGAAAGLFNAALNFMIISSLRLNDMKIVFATLHIHIGIAGVFLLLALMVGLHWPRRVALVFFKPQNPVL